jgi:riboflavin kinase/FMN adenylyltransferase
MKVHYGHENLKFQHPVVTVGVFDGVHRGHRALLKSLVERAAATGGESVVITFDPHPRLVVSSNAEEVFFLSTLDEKKKLLGELNIGHLIVIRFDRKLGNMDAEDFIRKILVDTIGVEHLIVGYDNHIGRDRTGNMAVIKKCAEIYGFTVEQAGETTLDERSVSSTVIRNSIIEGKVEEANLMLGYSYSLTGIVIEGRRLGRSFGFPTANIRPADIHKLVPGNGVYAVEVAYDDKIYYGMLSIGFNPTVNREKVMKSIEVNIFGFEDDLYNKSITIIFRYRLRDERKFGSVKHLTDQMALDRQIAIELLSRTNGSD